jgi:Xylanase inhibitor N-terminal
MIRLPHLQILALALLEWMDSGRIHPQREPRAQIRDDDTTTDENHGASAAVVDDNDDALDGMKIVTIPLLPHHDQRQRRRRRLTQELDNEEDLYLSEERPRQYPRRDRTGRRRRAEVDRPRGQRAQQQQVIGLYQGYGTHYADVWCGTPPQRRTLIVDTGSATTAFPCSACSRNGKCGTGHHTDGPYQELLSSSFHKLACADCFLGECRRSSSSHGTEEEEEECAFWVSYQEGSNWTAFEAIDSCYIGGVHNEALDVDPAIVAELDALDPYIAPNLAFDLRFGCQTQMSGHFRSQLADGIMGMDVGKPAIWNQMYLTGKISKRAFSLCFQRQRTAHRSGTGAGAMTFGGTDERLHKHAMAFSSTDLGGVGFFSVQLRKVYLRQGGGGDSVISTVPDLQIVPIDILEAKLNSGQVIIDSGTTDTYFVHQ